MKRLHKIMVLFAFIFISSVFVTIIYVNTSLNKYLHTKVTIGIQNDTLYLLQADLFQY